MDLSISLSNYPSSNHYTSSCVTTTNDIVSPLSNTNHDPTTGQSIQYLELLPHGPCYNNQTTHYAPNDLSDNDYTPSQLVPNITADALKLGNLMTAKNHELIYSKSPVESRRSSNPNTPTTTTTTTTKNWSMNISSSCYTIDVNEVPIITKIASNVSGQTCNYNHRNYNSANSSAEMIDGNSNSTVIKCKSNDSANSGSIKKRRLAGDQTNHEDYGHGDEEIYDDQEGISDHDDEEIYNANYALDQGAGNYCSMNSNSGGAAGRKKLRLSKQQSTLLEESFRRQSTLNPKQKNGLAKQLDLSPRQVEVWFQNRRARTKLKQTEADCELLKRCCESLTAENRRLRAEVAELRAMSRHAPPPPALPAPPVAPYNPHVAAEHPSRDGGGGGMIVDAIPNHPNRRRHRLTAPISPDHHDHTTTTTTNNTSSKNNNNHNHNNDHNHNHNHNHDHNHNHNHDHNHNHNHNHNHDHDHNHVIMYSSVANSSAAAIPGARISHLFPAALPDQQLLLLFQPPPPSAPSCASTTSAA